MAMKDTIQAKSDQLNADDLVAAPITVKITKIEEKGTKEQPIAIHYEGDNGKPFKPCLTMRRLILSVWGTDDTKFVGRRLTLYRDPKAEYGGKAVGGVRISHMSDITKSETVMLTVRRGKKDPFTVLPLEEEKTVNKSDLAARAEHAAKGGMEEYKKFFTELTNDEKKLIDHEKLKKQAQEADDANKY